MKVAIIGGGAAGFFSAIEVKENYTDAEVVIFEKSTKLLSKVKISGGGRCNLTNGETNIKKLMLAYPRGGTKLRTIFKRFNTQDTIRWFESKGVATVTQKDDNCVFPISQKSQSVIDCFMNEAKELEIKIEISKGVANITNENNQLKLDFFKEEYESEFFDKVIVTTGGSPKRNGLEWLEKLDHKIEDPVPSLFTFNMPKNPVTELMGNVVENAITSIQGTKLKASGPILITHWGMSGPAILKLSAYGARALSEMGYNFNLQVNWIGIPNFETVSQEIQTIVKDHPKKILSNFRPYLLPERLWHYLLKKMTLPKDKKWSELGKKGVNKIVTCLTNDIYPVKGKTTFKEEFVTCGGVSLEHVNLNTMESTVCPNLYFAGEVLDIDGITGGYNFQAAWSTGFVAGQLLSSD